MEAIDETKSTGFDLEDDVAIISLDTRSKLEGGALVEFAWAARYFETATLKTVPPQEHHKRIDDSRAYGGRYNSRRGDLIQGMDEDTLAMIRHTVKDVFEPLCRDANDKPIEQSDERSHNHAQHKTCILRKKVILLLPEKERCLRDLTVLGCNFHKGYVAWKHFERWKSC